jgi:hypothetical protein
MKKHFLDLFSGLGGASEAFVQDLGNWTVLRIDNNPLLGGVPYTVIDDIEHVANTINEPPTGFMEKIECIWASPPCTEFSGGFNSPKSKAARSPEGLDSYEPDMGLLIAALDIIKTVKPKYWVIENVIGSIRYFKEYLGEPRQIIGPYVLWGNFPDLLIDESKLDRKKDRDSTPHPLRSNRRAKVSFEVSRALKDAIENQSSIFDY